MWCKGRRGHPHGMQPGGPVTCLGAAPAGAACAVFGPELLRSWTALL